MATRTDPTVRRRKLGLELKRLREAANKKMIEVAAELNCSQAKISSIETGRYKVQPRDVRDMLAFYDVTDIEITDSLMQLARQSAEKSWWHSYSSAVPDWFGTYVGLEAEARTMKTFASHVIPGLLQTEEYARAVTLASFRTEATKPDDVVNLRKARQERLAGSNPLELWAIIEEPVLHRRVQSSEILCRQLEHLAEMARQSNIHVQVLPLSVGVHPGMANPFILLGFPDDILPEVVYFDHGIGALYLEDADEVAKYRQAFNHLVGEALGTDASLNIIRKTIEELS